MPFWFASTGSNRFVEMEGGPAPGNPKTLAETALSIVPGIRNLSAIAVMP